MSNIWKYASLSQKERLNLIRNGNGDVYNSENARNKMLKEERQSLGLSTHDIDNWQLLIDSANDVANDPYTVKTKIPVPTYNKNSEKDKVRGEFYVHQKDLKRQADFDRQDAIESAQKAEVYLSEWLANNGISNEGNFAGRERNKIKTELETKLSQIDSDYRKKAESLRDKYFNLFTKIVMAQK